MKCPKCGNENPPKNKFCGECGFNLQKISTENRMDIVKKDIPESLVQKILLTKDTIEKERKDVTVIFADISGFTSMSESLDPEELTLLMNDCFRKLSAMVYRYEGIIDKFIGDCIMAIFGAPVTHENDPERAILACLDMQLALNDINKNLKNSLKKLEIHSGINTGQVIAGKVGSDLQMDYTVMGDTVNVAQRLKDIAIPGSILVGPETFNRTRHAFDFITSDPVRLKGKAESIRPYEIVGRKWGSEFGLSTIHSDLIGRDQEISKLKQGYNNLMNNTTSIHILKGEIGVGKSRLLYEFKKFLTISAPDIALIDGRGISYESAIPFKFFGDCLRRFLLAEESRVTDKSDKIIKEKIVSHLGNDSDEIAPYIYKMLGIDLDEVQLEKIRHLDSHSLQLQIFLSIAALFEKISEKTSIIFIIDDIQWVDSTSLELISFLLPMLKRIKISFYLSYRIGDLSSIKKLINTIQDEYTDIIVEINLKNLKPNDSGVLIDNFMGQGVGESLKNYIIEKSAGNPFFIEEIVRSIVESGMLDQEKVIPGEKIQIPGSIEAAVSSRIDSLNKEAKYLLKIASIIGRSFPSELLKLVVKDKGIYQYIDELETSEFLIKVNRNNKIFHGFRHTLFQEVAYHSLLKSERTIYHKVIAETIEDKFKQDLDGYHATLTYHYFNCKDLEKTLEHSIKAGDEAAELYANEEALAHYKQALSVVDNESTKATILEKIGDIELLIGRNNQASKHLQEAKNIVRDELIKTRLAGKIGQAFLQMGELDKSIETMKKTLTSIQGNDNPVHAEINYKLANVLLEYKAETAQAEELVDTGIKIAKKIRDLDSEASCLRMKGHILYRRGKGDEALDAFSECKRLYESLENPKKLSEIFILMGVVSRSFGNINEAIDYAKKSISICQKIGDKYVLGKAYNNIGIYYSVLGDFKSALNYYEKNLELQQKVGNKRGEGVLLVNIGLVKEQIDGDLDTVLEYFNRAKEIVESINDIRSMAYIYWTTAERLANKGEIDRAVELFEKALKIAAETQDKLMLGEGYCVYAKYFLSINEVKKASELLESAREMILQTGNKVLLSQLFGALAELNLQNRNPDAIKYAEDGLKLALETRIKHDETFALRILGKAQALISGRFNEGIKNIKHSIAIAKETNLISAEADGLYALGEVFIANKKNKQALKYLNQAKKIYSKIGKKLPLEKVENLTKNIS